MSRFVQTRAGLLQHLQEGRMTMREFSVFNLLLLLADKASGLWWGGAPALSAHFGKGDLDLRAAQKTLASLEDAGYIKRFFVQGQRGNHPIGINKYHVSFGVLKGKYLNTDRSTCYKELFYEDGSEAGSEIGSEVGSDAGSATGTLSIPLYLKPQEDKIRQTETASAEATGDNSKTVSEAERIVSYIYRDILENKENPSERTLTKAVDKTIEALQTRSYERIKLLLDYARKNPFWYRAIGEADYPVSLFLKSIPEIEEQAQEATKKATRKAHVQSKAAQMSQPQTKTPAAKPAVKSQFLTPDKFEEI